MANDQEGSSKVAIYWDFENIHAALVDLRDGDGAYRKSRVQRQDCIMDVGAVMEYAATLGDIVINRAYADWGSFWKYKGDLLRHAVDLIQLFPRGSHAKNGADIRLALDAVEDIHHFPFITHVVIVAGDSDYIGVALKVRQAGKEIIGIGVEEATNRYWVFSCNEFKLYDTLVTKSSAKPAAVIRAPTAAADLREAKKLLTSAMRKLMTSREEEWIVKASLKPMMVRLNPAFDEANYGFKSFHEFLKGCSDVVRTRQGTHDHLVALLETVLAENAAEQQPVAAARAAPTNGEDADQQTSYVSLLKRQRIQLVDPGMRESTLLHVYEVFQQAPQGIVPSFEELRQLVQHRFDAQGQIVDSQAIRQVVDLVYKARGFQLLGEDGVGLKPCDSAQALVRSIDRFVVKRIASEADSPIDSGAVARLLFVSPEDRLDEARGLIDEVLADDD